MVHQVEPYASILYLGVGFCLKNFHYDHEIRKNYTIFRSNMQEISQWDRLFATSGRTSITGWDKHSKILRHVHA